MLLVFQSVLATGATETQTNLLMTDRQPPQSSAYTPTSAQLGRRMQSPGDKPACVAAQFDGVPSDEEGTAILCGASLDISTCGAQEMAVLSSLWDDSCSEPPACVTSQFTGATTDEEGAAIFCGGSLDTSACGSTESAQVSALQSECPAAAPACVAAQFDGITEDSEQYITIVCGGLMDTSSCSAEEMAAISQEQIGCAAEGRPSAGSSNFGLEANSSATGVVAVCSSISS